MNAIILAAGIGSRMNSTIHKTLLPILGIPNVERTVMFLLESDIREIYILVNNESLHQFEYLKELYGCTLVNVGMQSNTLFSMGFILDKFGDSYVIEGDVVLTRNIFINPTQSLYYTIRYSNCEKDAWCPIVENGRIVEFKIGCFSEPCLFGISFWTRKDVIAFKEELKRNMTSNNFNKSDIFWDDCLVNILDRIEVTTFEIDVSEATEMNTKNEYEHAQKMCKNYYVNCQKYMLNLDLRKYGVDQGLIVQENVEECKCWQLKLLKHTDGLESTKDLELTNNNIVFNKGEFPFMIFNCNSNEFVAYFDIAEAENYVLLRRLYICEKYRYKGIGSAIVNSLKMYTKIIQKELRVNVYDANAEEFYKKLNFKLYFKTYRV